MNHMWRFPAVLSNRLVSFNLDVHKKKIVLTLFKNTVASCKIALVVSAQGQSDDSGLLLLFWKENGLNHQTHSHVILFLCCPKLKSCLLYHE